VAAGGVPPAHLVTPEQARRNTLAAVPAVAGEAIPLPRVEDRTLELEGGRVPVRVYAPDGENLPVTLYFHGGGWVVGNLETHDTLCRRLAAGARSIVIAVDYRLAPEHPYPAAVEDCWAALRWAAEHAGEIGGDPARLAVAGDSAGGQLAASIALRARDAGIPLRLQVLIYPVTDHDFDTTSYRANAEGFGLLRETMHWYWDHFCPDPGQRAEPDASPLRAAELAGVAPALVVVCELDPLRDEGVAYAERLEAAGVPVTLIEEAGMIHGYARLFAVIDRAHKTVADVSQALERAFAKGMAEATR
jgi:acetyl esterase